MTTLNSNSHFSTTTRSRVTLTSTSVASDDILSTPGVLVSATLTSVQTSVLAGAAPVAEGSLELSVASADLFVHDAGAKRALERSISSLAGVDEWQVRAELSLQPSGRRLSSPRGVLVTYVIISDSQDVAIDVSTALQRVSVATVQATFKRHLADNGMGEWANELEVSRFTVQEVVDQTPPLSTTISSEGEQTSAMAWVPILAVALLCICCSAVGSYGCLAKFKLKMRTVTKPPDARGEKIDFDLDHPDDQRRRPAPQIDFNLDHWPDAINVSPESLEQLPAKSEDAREVQLVPQDSPLDVEVLWQWPHPADVEMGVGSADIGSSAVEVDSVSDAATNNDAAIDSDAASEVSKFAVPVEEAGDTRLWQPAGPNRLVDQASLIDGSGAIHAGEDSNVSKLSRNPVAASEVGLPLSVLGSTYQRTSAPSVGTSAVDHSFLQPSSAPGSAFVARNIVKSRVPRRSHADEQEYDRRRPIQPSRSRHGNQLQRKETTSKAVPPRTSPSQSAPRAARRAEAERR